MSSFLVGGGRQLKGEVRVSGSKNSSLPVLAAALLTDDEVVVHGLPSIADVHTMLEVLQHLGCRVQWEKETIVIQPRIKRTEAPYELVKRMRASFYVSGPLLGRVKRAEVPLPGGCVIGSRPVDFHIQAFRQLGAKVKLEYGYMKAKAAKLHGARVYLDPRWCSVGTTINIILASVLCEGETTIENAARDPEILDLVSFLRKMGSDIRGETTSTLVVKGVKRLNGCEHHIIGDRIEAGTYLCAAAMTGGDVTVAHSPPEFMRTEIEKFREVGCEVEEKKEAIRLRRKGPLHSLDLITAPYPGFPTDLQPSFVSVLSKADGASVVEETIHDSRFRYVDELRRMGANVRRVDNTAVIKGVRKLLGAPVEASDLRAGAALVVAGLAAEGRTEVLCGEHIDRGYEDFEGKLRRLGADIERVP